MTVRSNPRASSTQGPRLGWRARKHAAGTTSGVQSGGGLHNLASSRHRRDAGVPQDRALYSCDCGLVFHAAVSTSVGCPECGSTQAW